MKISLLVPGTGSFYCGSCLRDGALARALAALGHAVEVVPLYLPLLLEEQDEPQGPVRMGGINLYLQQKLPALGALRWATGWLDDPRLLRWAAARGDMTDASAHAAMALSMLRGEQGRQRREVERLARELARSGLPDVFLLSNAMLIGVARTLKARLGVPLVCTLQGEAPYLDSFPEPMRAEAWGALAERTGDIDAFIAVSHSYGEELLRRLSLDARRVHVVHNGIDLAGFGEHAPPPPTPPTVGYLARLCPDKGLHTLVEAFVRLSAGGRVKGARLRVAGALLERDAAWLAGLERRLGDAGVDFEFRPNVGRARKLELLRSLHVLSVPATYGESFGLYVLEALASGVPVVEPRHGAFPELLEATGGGVLCEPDDPASLARELEALLLDPPRRAELGSRGRAAVRARFTSEHMARGVEQVLLQATGQLGMTKRERRSTSEGILSSE
jgi:glycosyltransferase involved in cell wall biosynthesis